MLRKLHSMIWRAICLAMPSATILYRFFIVSNVLLLMSVHVKEETLHTSEAETPSELFTVTLDTESASKVVPCSLLELLRSRGGADAGLSSSNNSFPAVIEDFYRYIIIYV